MTDNLSYNNFVKENKNTNSYSSYLNRLNGKNKDNHKKTFQEDLFDNYEFNIPQFYLSNNGFIKGFHNISINYEIFNNKYENLKKILEFNKEIFQVPLTNLNINFSKTNHLIFKNLDFDKAYDFNYLIKNKSIFENLRNYKTNLNIYDKVKSNIFTKIIDEKLEVKEKKIFIKIYKDLIKTMKTILKYNYSMGVMGYSNLFTIENNINTNFKKNKDKYVLLTNKLLNRDKINNSKNDTNKLDESLMNYTKLYNSYNYNKKLSKIKLKINEHCSKFHNLSLKLSQKSYSSLYDLLNIIIDQEYHLLNFILNFNDINNYKKILEQDSKIKQYIKRNLLNFSSYKNDYMIVKKSSIDKEDLFEIPNYDVNKFFTKE